MSPTPSGGPARPHRSFPLSPADREAGRSPDAQAAIDARLCPLISAGLLDPIDVHAVDLATRRCAEHRPELLLALCLAARAPRAGDLCLDLDAPLPAAPAAAEGTAPTPDPGYPLDRAAWRAAIAGSPAVTVEGAVQGAAVDGAVGDERRPFWLHGARLYTDRYWRYERGLAEALRARAARDRPVHDPDGLKLGLLSLFPRTPEMPAGLDRQQLAAAMACMRGLLVLSGGPGTGKTHTLRNLLTLSLAQHAAGPEAGRPLRVRLAAPTGKAAARMREAIHKGLAQHCEAQRQLLGAGGAAALEAFFLGLLPTTLHRVLGTRFDAPTRFIHNAENHLQLDILIIDEASMVDAHLMARTLEALPPGAQLILLGDRDQLASVEAGAVLADLCAGVKPAEPCLSPGMADRLEAEAGLALAGSVRRLAAGADPGLHDATVQLTHSRRFGEHSGVGKLAKAVIGGDPAAARAALEPRRYPDLDARGLKGGLGDAELALVIDGRGDGADRPGGFARYLDRLFAGPKPGEDDVAHHKAVLMLFDEVRLLSATREGRRGVEGLNRAVIEALAQRYPSRRFSGQSWLGRPVLITENDPGTGRTNGDVGIFVPRPGQPGDLQVAFLGAAGVEYQSSARLPPHETVFAMTVHKSQGSEFFHTVMVLPSRENRVLTRELLYTGVTRASHQLTLLGLDEPGENSVLDAAIRARVQRSSGLGARLWGHLSSN
jgi:exodeoxyribonuclease V alpha subunit